MMQIHTTGLNQISTLLSQHYLYHFRDKSMIIVIILIKKKFTCVIVNPDEHPDDNDAGKDGTEVEEDMEEEEKVLTNPSCI